MTKQPPRIGIGNDSEASMRDQGSDAIPPTPAHNDLLTLINEVDTGVALTDDHGRVVFANRSARQLLRDDAPAVEGVAWDQLWPLRTEDRMQLRDMADRPAAERESVSVQIRTGKGRQLWVDVAIRDDPRGPGACILLFKNEVEIHDLGSGAESGATFQGMIGKSEPMRRLYAQIEELSAVDATVLLEGETGAGKELVARALHTSGPRRHQPFVAFNCAGLTDTLIGSQLFGHKRGSFTGAINDQRGLIETAHSGTLFLDEIGDVSVDVQRNLLRVLQEREIMRVGEARSRKVDVRVIAATNRNLNTEVDAGRFRADLLYRIRVARILVPPLRERHVDIPLLVDAFLNRIAGMAGKPARQMSKDAMRMLMAYPWPGNVRELQSAIEFAAIRSKGLVIQPTDLPPEFTGSGSGRSEVMTSTEKERVLVALRTVRGNRSAAARLLGIGRATLYRRLAEWEVGVDPEDDDGMVRDRSSQDDGGVVHTEAPHSIQS